MRSIGGQSMVEVAITLPVMMILLFVTIQYAIIGNAALAVMELAYAGARYAATNPTADGGSVASYMKSIASPTIGDDAGNNLSVTLSPSTAPRVFGTKIQVTISYNLKNKLFLSNPFLGVSFPAAVSGVQVTMLSE